MAFTEEWLEQHNAKMAAQRVAGGAVRMLDRPVDAKRTVGGTGDDCSAVSRGAWPPECADGIGGGERGPELSVTAGETAAKRKRGHPEQTLQIQAVKFLHLALPRDWRVVHVANGVAAGGQQARIANAIRKAMGVRDGFPDLSIFGPGRYVVAEAKAGKGRLSTAQAEWRDWFMSIGVPWFVFRDHDELVAGCIDAGVPLRVRAP